MAKKRPTILFLMTDQMQGRVLQTKSPCQTPHFDRLADRGMLISNAYTPNAVCSPARASLMTGLLPHNHGVLQVTHTADVDQNVLRRDRVHWAQLLEEDGYRTGYFGKWHLEHTDHVEAFGWQANGTLSSSAFQQKKMELTQGQQEQQYSLAKYNEFPAGYKQTLLYGVTNVPAYYAQWGSSPT